MNNGRRWIWEIAIGALALTLTAWGTWTAAIRTDAAFHERIEIFMDENKDDLATIHALATTEAVHSEQIGELGRSQARTEANVEVISTLVQRYLQAQMTEGKIPR